MGFFNKLFGNNSEDAELCTICGSPLPSKLIPFNGTEKLADGRICKACAAQVSPWVSGFKQITSPQMAEHLAYRQANREQLNSFMESYRLGLYHILIAIDETHQWILFSRQQDYINSNADILSLDQISSAQMEITERVSHQTEYTRDTHEPFEIEKHEYAFFCRIGVNSNWFTTISFYTGTSSSIDFMEAEKLSRAYDEMCAICRLFDQLGIPYEWMDHTYMGIDAILSGGAMGMMMNGMGPDPMQNGEMFVGAMGVGAIMAGSMSEQTRRMPGRPGQMQGQQGGMQARPEQMQGQQERMTGRPGQQRQPEHMKGQTASGPSGSDGRGPQSVQNHSQSKKSESQGWQSYTMGDQDRTMTGQSGSMRQQTGPSRQAGSYMSQPQESMSRQQAGPSRQAGSMPRQQESMSRQSGTAESMAGRGRTPAFSGSQSGAMSNRQSPSNSSSSRQASSSSSGSRQASSGSMNSRQNSSGSSNTRQASSRSSSSRQASSGSSGSRQTSSSSSNTRQTSSGSSGSRQGSSGSFGGRQSSSGSNRSSGKPTR